MASETGGGGGGESTTNLHLPVRYVVSTVLYPAEYLVDVGWEDMHIFRRGMSGHIQVRGSLWCVSTARRGEERRSAPHLARRMQEAGGAQGRRLKTKERGVPVAGGDAREGAVAGTRNLE
jgi:hypothetical protein